MPRVKKDSGVGTATVPRPRATPKTDPLEGLDYTIEKEPGGRWRGECLGVTAYGTTKKNALFMLGEELNGFKSEGPTIPPVVDETVLPGDATCQEASMFSKSEYVPCGAPAVAIVHHEKDHRSYYMCLPCSDHNVRNRGGVYRFGPVPTSITLSPAQATALLTDGFYCQNCSRVLVTKQGAMCVACLAIVPKYTKGESYSIDDAELLWGIEFPSKPDLLRQLFLERIQLKDQADRTKARIDEINKSLLSFYDRQGVGEVKWEDFTVARVNGSNSTLDKEALVLEGVPAETIARCTRRKEYVTIRVTGPKGGE